MAVFPLFVDLRGKKCLVAGGGAVACRKVETLLMFDAAITVVSPRINKKIEELKLQNRISVIPRNYTGKDLEGSWLVIGATSDRAVNEQIYQDAIRNNLWVNIADNPEECTFVFPSVVKRDELVVGISTSGGYPALSRRVRQKVESVVPESYGKTLQTLKLCRKKVDEEITDAEKRKEVLGRLLDELLDCEDHASDERVQWKIASIFKEFKNEESH